MSHSPGGEIDRDVVRAIGAAKNKGALNECPACRADVARIMLPVMDVSSQRMVPLVCSNCGFTSLHSMDQLLEPLPPPDTSSEAVHG